MAPGATTRLTGTLQFWIEKKTPSWARSMLSFWFTAAFPHAIQQRNDRRMGNSRQLADLTVTKIESNAREGSSLSDVSYYP